MRRSFPLVAAGILVLAGCAVPPADLAVPAPQPAVVRPATAVPTTPVRGPYGPVVPAGIEDEPTPSPTPAPTTPTPTAQPKRHLQPGPAIMAIGSNGGQVRELQARLRQIAWFDRAPTGHYGQQTAASVTGFQAKRGIPRTGEVDQRTWDALVAMTRRPSADELKDAPPKKTEVAPAKLDPRCMTGRVMCISKATRMLSWVVDGKVLMTVDVRFGSQELPTREGAFSVGWKSRDHVSNLYHTKMPFAMFFSGGQAVHYSPDFAARGYNGASHGCVNVRDRAAIESLFDQVKVGDKVIVHR